MSRPVTTPLFCNSLFSSHSRSHLGVGCYIIQKKMIQKSYHVLKTCFICLIKLSILGMKVSVPPTERQAAIMMFSAIRALPFFKGLFRKVLKDYTMK